MPATQQQQQQQQRTIFLRDKETHFPNWEIVQTFTEPAIEFYCDRSKLSLAECEDKECAKQMGHKAKSRVGQVQKAVIRKVNGP